MISAVDVQISQLPVNIVASSVWLCRRQVFLLSLFLFFGPTGYDGNAVEPLYRVLIVESSCCMKSPKHGELQ